MNSSNRCQCTKDLYSAHNFTITPEQRQAIADKIRKELHALDLDNTIADYLVEARIEGLIEDYIYG